MFLNYRFSVLLSIGLHSVLLACLLSNGINSKQYLVKKPVKSQEIVHAVSIDNQQVMAEMAKIKEEKQLQAKARLTKQKRLDELAQEAKKNRIREQNRVKQLKQQARLLEKNQAIRKKREARRLTALKLKQEKEQQRLAKLKKEQAKLKQKTDQLKAREASRQALQEKRLQALRSKKEAAEKQARMSGIVNKYKALIVNAIGQNWILPDNVDKNASCKFEIKLAPGGAVMSVKLLRSSGDAVLDRSAQTAIYKASPLPVPNEKDAFNIFRVVSLTVRPESIMSNS